MRQLDPTVRVYCAYNCSRKTLICLSIEIADILPSDLRHALDALTPDSQKALWLIPFRGIAASHVNTPIDLLFLDQNNCVLSMAESFPDSQTGSWNWPVGSAIALPAGTIATSGTLTGDQLFLCSPEKMKRRFVDLEMPEDDQTPISSRGPQNIATSDGLRNKQEDALERTPAEATQRDATISEPVTGEPNVEDLTAKEREWLLWLLAPFSEEERMTPRESLPSITAYFFSGGTPAPAEVRNISSLGMYVITTERWYPGTIVRVTLSDSRLPRARTITVNAMAVRADENGVGMRFVFAKPRQGKTSHPDHRVMVEITRAEIREFLQDLKRRERQTT